ncbi:hypothetical protein HCA73_03010 [Listeria booriae]|uniref:hypothetical protein n=1 Tax=Listeria booriae TaxID=1552123 RepID=UPI00162688C5|nr:hypothetical protein [Listeria booriae]MBC1911608.1 hypothetical protein [Listeria booriae]
MGEFLFVLTIILLLIGILGHFSDKKAKRLFQEKVDEDESIDYGERGVRVYMDNSTASDYLCIKCSKWQENKANFIEGYFGVGKIVDYDRAKFRVKSIQRYPELREVDEDGKETFYNDQFIYKAKVELYEDKVHTITNNFNNNNVGGNFNIDQSINHNETIYNMIDELIEFKDQVTPEDCDFLELLKYKLKEGEANKRDIDRAIDKVNKYVPVIAVATSIVNLLLTFYTK